jgi:hypothetical protein
MTLSLFLSSRHHNMGYWGQKHNHQPYYRFPKYNCPCSGCACIQWNGGTAPIILNLRNKRVKQSATRPYRLTPGPWGTAASAQPHKTGSWTGPRASDFQNTQQPARSKPRVQSVKIIQYERVCFRNTLILPYHTCTDYVPTGLLKYFNTHRILAL